MNIRGNNGNMMENILFRAIDFTPHSNELSISLEKEKQTKIRNVVKGLYNPSELTRIHEISGETLMDFEQCLGFGNKIRDLYKTMKVYFPKMIEYVLPLLNEESQKFSIIQIIKSFLLNSIETDEFLFISLQDEHWDLYDSVDNTFKTIDRTKEFGKHLAAIKSGQLMQIRESHHTEIINLINPSFKDKRGYMMKTTYNNKEYLVAYIAKMSSRSVLDFFSKQHDDIKINTCFYELSVFLVDTVYLNKVLYFSKDDMRIAQLLKINEIFLTISYFIFLLKVKNIIKEDIGTNVFICQRSKAGILKKGSGIVQNEEIKEEEEDSEGEEHFPKPKDLLFDIPTSSYTFLIKNNDSNLISSKIQTFFNYIVEYYIKYKEFIISLVDNYVFFKHFIYSSKNLLIDFNKLGELQFISNNPCGRFSLDFSSDNLHYSKILAHSPYILNKIKNFLEKISRDIGEDYLEELMKTPKFKLIIKRNNKMNYKGFYLIFDSESEADRVKAHSVSSEFSKSVQDLDDDDDEISKKLDEELNSPSIPSSLRERIKKKVRDLKITGPLNRIKLHQMKIIQKNNSDFKNTFLQEFLPRNSELLANKDSDSNSFTTKNSSDNETHVQPRRIKHSLTSYGQKEVAADPSKQIRKLRGLISVKPEDNLISKECTVDHFVSEEVDVENSNNMFFNILDFKGDPKQLYKYAWLMLEMNNFMNHFSIELNCFVDFLHELKKNYNKRNNPFHNFEHGIAVMHCCYNLMRIPATNNILGELDKFSLIFSGLCHDVAHNGFTNNFEIASKSKLANRYLDKSPLEHHHIATTFKILSKDKLNIFSNTNQDDLKQIKKLMISNILATDIKEHFNLMSNFESKLKQLKETNEEYGSSESERVLLGGMLLHTADFTATTKPFPISRTWSLRVNREFSHQYEQEGKLGIPLTPYLKDLDKLDVMAKAEIGFLRVIVRPLWMNLNELLEHELDQALKNLDDNIIEWDKLHNSGKDQPSGVLTEDELRRRSDREERQSIRNKLRSRFKIKFYFEEEKIREGIAKLKRENNKLGMKIIKEAAREFLDDEEKNKIIEELSDSSSKKSFSRSEILFEDKI